MIRTLLEKILFTLCILAILTGLSFQLVEAQIFTSQWTSPEQLSSESAQASRGYMISDQFGYTHVFWSESVLSSQISSIQYSRFDGNTWLPPLDIYISPPNAAINFIDPFVDRDSTLHLIWALSNTSPILYSNAPAHDAYSARKWSKPIIIDAPAFSAKLLLDSEGTMHVFYSESYGNAPGVYYIKSLDHGNTWTSALHLDPDIPGGYTPFNVSFDIDSSDGLHILWYYIDPTTTNFEWIRYSRSMDGGNTWELPFTIDKADEAPGELRAAHPELLVNDQTVHVIWAGDKELHREHRYSIDAGKTWTEPNLIWGNLVGQALGGGLAVDSSGRLHYTAQVRYPMGIYHAYWENGVWSIPNLIYFIQASFEDTIIDRIHAHNVRMAIRGGNQPVVTFTTAPADPQFILFEIQTQLNDTPEIKSDPTPVPTVLPTIVLTELPESENLEQTPNSKVDLGSLSEPPNPYRPSIGVIWGAISSSILLVALLVYRFFKK